MRLIIPIALMLAACGDDGDRMVRPTPTGVVTSTNMLDTSQVEVGPVIDGKNYSLGNPWPKPSPLGGWEMPIGPDIEPHYVTFRHGPLSGKTRIRMRYSLSHDMVGAGCAAPGTITVYFQRSGDDWRRDGNRWWATFATKELLAGEHEIIAPFDGNWTSVDAMTSRVWVGAFNTAKINADRVGFTFGNCTGYGHGARGVEPGTFRLIDYRVE